MQIFLGDKKCNNFYIGNMKVTRIYIGSKLIYSDHPFVYDYYYPTADSSIQNRLLDNFQFADDIMKVESVMDKHPKAVLNINKCAALVVTGHSLQVPITEVSKPIKIICDKVNSFNYKSANNADLCNICTDRITYDKVKDKKVIQDECMKLSYSTDSALPIVDYVLATEDNTNIT